VVKWGDLIAIYVQKGWADAIGETTWLQYLNHEETPTARVFVARLVTTENRNGLWIEPATNEGKDDVMYVPWSAILAIRSQPEATRRTTPDQKTPVPKE
jgi:hypothetical protein